MALQNIDWIFSGFNTVIQSTIKQSRIQSWESYQTAADNRIAMLQGDWDWQLRDFVQSVTDASAWAQIYSRRMAFFTSQNVMQDVVNKTLKLYNRSPLRQFIYNNKPDSTYEELMKEISENLNLIMNEALRFSYVGGSVLIRPVYDEVNKIWYFHILTPGSFIPIADQDQPSKMVAVQYQYTSRDNLSQIQTKTIKISMLNGVYNGQPVVPFYQEIDHYKNVTINLQGDQYPFYDDNGDPYLPVVLGRINNESCELVNKTQGKDLFDSTLKAGWFEVQKEWLIRHQSHKQLAIIGKLSAETRNQIMDPALPIILENATVGEAELKLLDTKTDPAVFDKEVDKEVEREAGKRGFSLSDFRASAQRQTAEALTIQSKERSDYIDRIIAQWSVIETGVNNVIRNFNNALIGPKIPMEAKFKIVYTKPNDSTLVAGIDNYIKMYDFGILSKAEILRAYDPNLTMEEANDIIQKNETEREKQNDRLRENGQLGNDQIPNRQAGNGNQPNSPAANQEQR